MKKLTLTADEDLIKKARLLARAQGKTLNTVFREWLLQFTSHANSAWEFDSLMKHLRHVRAGGHPTRDQLNQR
jgi:hypothetical protein